MTDLHEDENLSFEEIKIKYPAFFEVMKRWENEARADAYALGISFEEYCDQSGYESTIEPAKI